VGTARPHARHVGTSCPHPDSNASWTDSIHTVRYHLTSGLITVLAWNSGHCDNDGPSSKNMLRHRWKILIGLFVVLISLTGIELATIGNGPKEEVEAYKKSLIAKGEKLEISELLPPPVPPGQNGANVIIEALNMATVEDYSNLVSPMRMIAPGKAIVCFEQPEIRDDDFTNSWSNALAVVEADRPMTELLKQAVNYPIFDFYLDYNGDGRDARYYEPLEWSVNRLSTEAMCDLHQGDPPSAVTNICVMLALINGERDDRQELFQISRIHLTWFAANANWALLQSSNVTDAELTILQREWERPEYIHSMENTLLMQRAWMDSEIAKVLASNDYFEKEMQPDDWSSVDWSDGLGEGFNDLLYNAKLACSVSMYRASWIYWDELHALKNRQLILEALRTVETNGVFNPAYNNMVKQLEASASDQPHDLLVKLDDEGLYHSLSTYSSDFNLVSLTMGAEATRRMAITAIALKRYRLKNGMYPSTLSDLVPQFISSVPQDPVDGKALRYQLTPEGDFLLYSIGENGKDDGGDGSDGRTMGRDYSSYWINPRSLDWVWPRPATAAEIKYFYAHPPR
jgi:hypothetical protein